MTTATFPAGSLRAIRRGGRIYVSHDDLISAFDVWLAVLRAAGAAADLIELVETQRDMLAELDVGEQEPR